MDRDYNFISGVETPDLPAASAPTAEGDLITLEFLRKVTGSRGTPQQIVAADGIAFVGGAIFNTWFVKGSGGAVDITANPQIAAGDSSKAGVQRLILVGRDDTNTVKIEDGNGVVLKGGGEVFLFANTVIEFLWDGTNWVEIGV